MMFLFVSASVCVRLPSDSTSQWTPCLSLTVPTTKPVTDFHRQDITHAGRTNIESIPHCKVQDALFDYK
ncbi:hypothetical protein DOS77_02905 [Staphylococcus felis]|nr:hypothetical protein DOS62_02010 [Staphylococcus felis]REI24131.1 hypothetical protein DOS77_02905 [Staphylococcus felis]